MALSRPVLPPLPPTPPGNVMLRDAHDMLNTRYVECNYRSLAESSVGGRRSGPCRQLELAGRQAVSEVRAAKDICRPKHTPISKHGVTPRTMSMGLWCYTL